MGPTNDRLDFFFFFLFTVAESNYQVANDLPIFVSGFNRAITVSIQC